MKALGFPIFSKCMKNNLISLVVIGCLVAVSYAKRCDVVIENDHVLLCSYVYWHELASRVEIQKASIRRVDIAGYMARSFHIRIITDEKSYPIKESASVNAGKIQRQKEDIVRGLRTNSFKISFYELNAFFYLSICIAAGIVICNVASVRVIDCERLKKKSFGEWQN